MKRILFVLVIVFVLFLSAPTVAMEPIPEGTQLAVFLNNFSQLPIAQLFEQNRFIPPQIRDGLSNFMKASGFNIFSDIFSVQIFVAWEGKRPMGAGILKGKFDVEKLGAWVKLILGENLENIPFLEQTILSDKKGKMFGICFIENSTIVIGFVPFVKKVLEARQSGASSPMFAEILPKLNEKAYLTLFFVGREQIAGLIDHTREKISRRAGSKKPEEFLKKIFFEAVVDGVSLNYILAQRLDDRGEFWINFDRGDKKNVGVHVLMETDDQRLFISSFLKIMADKLIQPAPEAPAKDK